MNKLMISARWLLLVGLASAGPQVSMAARPLAAALPQLNQSGFAHCLGEVVPRLRLEDEKARYDLGTTDLLLLYLSVYPGKRFPAPLSLLQDRAHDRWARAFESRERELAERFWARHGMEAPEGLSPARFFGDALVACDGSPLCAAVISHNVTRTLGRHAQAAQFNPEWFVTDRRGWLERIPTLQRSLMSLRPAISDRGRAENWGEWYHFFGILAFSLRELALDSGTAGVEFAVRMGELLNPLLAGGPESAEKARHDRDSVGVSWRFARGLRARQPLDCDARSSYVALPDDDAHGASRTIE